MKKIISTKNLKPDSILRVYKPGFGYGILKIIDNNDFFLTCKCENKNLYQKLNYSDKLETYFWTEENGALEWGSEIIGKTIHNDQIIILNHSTDILYTEIRKCIRLKTELDFDFITVGHFNLDNGNFESNSADKISGKILELTDRTALVKSPIELDINEVLKGHFKMNNDLIDLVGIITKTDKINCYKMEFKGLQDKNRIKILDYIYETYRE